jgi:hypothetical protein
LGVAVNIRPLADPWRALITFTTSNRPSYVKRCLPHLARACAGDQRLSILVALDGNDTETRAFCAQWEVPLLYSDVREGVGLSKNRVLKSFPDCDYYFFLEDDVEVLDGSLFASHIDLMRAGGIHHMSLFDRSDGQGQTGETMVLGQRIVHFSYGSAEFNAFTREGLEQVGGWHPTFAQYRRWGHTEHSYRFQRNGLAPAPFNVAVDLAGACIRHRPPSVTPWAEIATLDAEGIAAPERELMARELENVPVQTIAPYHVSPLAPAQLPSLARVPDDGDRYPLLSGAERRRAQSDYMVWRFETLPHPGRRLCALLLAALLCPSSVTLRHAAKVRVVALRRRLRPTGD